MQFVRKRLYFKHFCDILFDDYIDLNSTYREYNEYRQINAAPVKGYTLSVEIIVQTVQAIGYTGKDDPNGVIPAYQDAWNRDTN